LLNWWEFIALAFACARIGAVSNPVMPIFRQHELKYILNFGQSKVFVVPQTHLGFDYEAMARGMLADLQHLKHLVIVDGDGADSFCSAAIARQRAAAEGSRPRNRRRHAADVHIG
jgi:cyclohexanecarboxylate-CoA ligase